MLLLFDILYVKQCAGVCLQLLIYSSLLYASVSWNRCAKCSICFHPSIYHLFPTCTSTEYVVASTSTCMETIKIILFIRAYFKKVELYSYVWLWPARRTEAHSVPSIQHTIFVRFFFFHHHPQYVFIFFICKKRVYFICALHCGTI